MKTPILHILITFALMSGAWVHTSFAQTSLPATLLGSSADGMIKLMQECDENGNCFYVLHYHMRLKPDTLALDITEHNMDSCHIDEVQIDGKGRKEIILTEYFAYQGSIIGTGGYQVIQEKNEVWNLDDRKLIFSALSYDYYWSSYTKDVVDSAGEAYGGPVVEETSMYSYDFKVSERGQITIKNIKTSHTREQLDGEGNVTENKEISPSQTDYHIRPDHAAGVYTYANGKFVSSPTSSHPR